MHTFHNNDEVDSA